MGLQIVEYGFIDQQMPLRGQLCVVLVHNDITNISTYRIRFLPQPEFGQDVIEDCREAARSGSKLPQLAGRALLNEIGDREYAPITVKLPYGF